MRILYVEDNPANLFLVQRVARMGNHDVVNYAEGQPALDNFKTDKPDLVLMDIQLSGVLNGLDVVRALRAAGYKTPIIAVTAYAMAGDREKCIEAGCDGYLSKPLPVGELVELFKRYQPAQVGAAVSSAPAASASSAAVEVKPEPAPEAKPAVASQPVNTPVNVEPAAEAKPAPTAPAPIELVKAAVPPVPSPVISAPLAEPEVKAPAPTTPSAQPPAAIEPAKESAPVQAASMPTEAPKAESAANSPATPAETSTATDPLPQQGVSKEKDEKISLESKQS